MIASGFADPYIFVNFPALLAAEPARNDASGARLTVNHHPTPTDPITPPGAIVFHVFALDPTALTAAHKSLPFNSKVRVTNVALNEGQRPRIAILRE